MPELKFREEEPERSIPVMPTVSRQAEIRAVAAEVHAEPPRVRYGEWQSPENFVPPYGFQIPKWLFLAGSAIVWIGIVIELLLPKVYFHDPELPSRARIPIPSPLIAFLFIAVSVFVLLMIALVQAIRMQSRFKRRMWLDRPLAPQLNLEYLLAPRSTRSETEVSAIFLQDGFICARDRGCLRVEDSSVYFEGERTYFSLCKSRLRLTPPGPSLRSGLFSVNPNAMFSRLTYREEGIEYGFGFVNAHPLGLNTAKREAAGLKRWLEHPSEPAEYEVLLPAAIPSEAPREALESLRGPILAAQGILFFLGMFAQVLLDVLHTSATRSGSHMLPILSPILLILAAEFAWFVAALCILPAVRALRRYRFLRSRLRAAESKIR